LHYKLTCKIKNNNVVVDTIHTAGNDIFSKFWHYAEAEEVSAEGKAQGGRVSAGAGRYSLLTQHQILKWCSGNEN
jgi:hypothetical protein